MNGETIKRWRPVLGYEGRYEISGSGDVLSLARTLPDGRRRKARLLKTFPMPDTGYLSVRLSKHGRARTRSVHQLVAEAFHGPRPPGHENTRDQVRHGTHRGLRKNRLRNEGARK